MANDNNTFLYGVFSEDTLIGLAVLFCRKELKQDIAVTCGYSKIGKAFLQIGE